jgi:hypothetical protein
LPVAAPYEHGYVYYTEFRLELEKKAPTHIARSLLVLKEPQMNYQGALLMKEITIPVAANMHASITIPTTIMAAIATPLPPRRSTLVSFSSSVIENLLNYTTFHASPITL